MIILLLLILIIILVIIAMITIMIVMIMQLVQVPVQPAPMRWLRTNGVNTNGATAEVMHFVRLGKKVRPGTFGKTKVG